MPRFVTTLITKSRHTVLTTDTLIFKSKLWDTVQYPNLGTFIKVASQISIFPDRCLVTKLVSSGNPVCDLKQKYPDVGTAG